MNPFTYILNLQKQPVFPSIWTTAMLTVFAFYLGCMAETQADQINTEETHYGTYQVTNASKSNKPEGRFQNSRIRAHKQSVSKWGITFSYFLDCYISNLA